MLQKPTPAPAPAKDVKTSKPAKTDKTSRLLWLLKGNGNSVETITAALGWKPHTLRARLSGLAKPPMSLKIERERKDGVTSYRIGA